MEGQIIIFDLQCEDEMEVQMPCNRKCSCAFGSILCFEKRGQMYDRIHREWCKDDSGKPLVRDTKECDWKPKSAYDIFHEDCRHRGWYRKATETEPGSHMCGYANKRLAQNWADWIPCTEGNCPLMKED